MPNDSLLAASIIVCESVQIDHVNNVWSAISIIDVLTLPPYVNTAHFFTIAHLQAKPLDLSRHILQIKLARDASRNVAVAQAPEYSFVYGHSISLTVPGGCLLKTEFTVDVNTLGSLGLFFAQAWLDGKLVAHKAITLRRS